jgi:hypothetical protein
VRIESSVDQGTPLHHVRNRRYWYSVAARSSAAAGLLLIPFIAAILVAGFQIGNLSLVAYVLMLVPSGILLFVSLVCVARARSSHD